MPYTIGAIKVKNFTNWKSAFDNEDGKALRRIGGMRSYQIFQASDDPNYVVILTEWDSVDDGRKFIQSKELQEANKESGVVEMFATHDTSKSLEEVEKKSV